jgi:hypothetical protein
MLAPIVYVGSFGPACRIADHFPSVWKPVWTVYQPLVDATCRGCPWALDLLIDYGTSDVTGIPIALELCVDAEFNARRNR